MSLAGRRRAAPQPPVDSGLLRKVLGRFPTGVAVVTAHAETPCGMTANAFTSVSLDPPMILVCVNRSAAIYQAVLKTGCFGVSVLSAGQEHIARYFANHSRPRGEAEFDAVGWSPGPMTGTPMLDGSLAWLDCALTTSYDGGDHEIFLGTVLASGFGTAQHALVFFGGGFHRPLLDHQEGTPPPPEPGDDMTVTNPAPPGVAGRVYPGPPLRAVPGLLRKLWYDRLSLLSDAAVEFGDVVRFAMGPKTIYFFNHPDHAKHVLADNADNYHKGMGLAQARRLMLGDGLLTSEGETWRRERRALAPAFRRERIAGFADAVADIGALLVERLQARVGAGTVDLTDEMTWLTMNVLGKTLLDADLMPLRMLGPAFEVMQDQAMFEMVTLGALPLWLPLPRNRRFRLARRQLEESIRTLVASRGSGRVGDGTDVLSLLLAARGDEPDAGPRWRGLRDELVTILLAGHETTASTLSWTWYLLARHPEAASAVRAEALEVLGDRTPGLDDLTRLPYTTTVIQEAMRLYPPVWGLPRKALAADEIDGYRIPAGADVMICPYTLHRHPGFWPDPERFVPERFALSGPPAAHRYAYIPFGAGPRVCVGSQLGMMEAVLIAAMVGRRFRFGSGPGGSASRAQPLVAGARRASGTGAARVTAEVPPAQQASSAFTAAHEGASRLRQAREAVARGDELATQRQHDRRKLTARERLALLLDEGSFTELDLFRRPEGAAFTDGVVTGAGTVNGRRVFAYAQDFRILGGSLGEVHAAKIHKVMDLALATGAPLIAINDSGGARIQEGVTALAGYGGIFRRNVRASGVIPQISVILGPCAGGAAYSPALTDFVFMVPDTSYMFVTGPDVIKAVTGEAVTHDGLGGAQVHGGTSGVATFVCDNEESCLGEVRYLLSLLPDNSHEFAPAVRSADPPDRSCPELLTLVPGDPRKPYDMLRVVAEIADHGEFMELHADWAKSIICALARIGGHTVGIVANQPLVRAGVLDIQASQKAARFVSLCDAFNIPLVTLVDVPGFLPGVGQEHNGIIRHGARLLYAYCDATVPRVQVILRKAYGGAYIVMDSRSIGADLSFAWPGNEIAVMGAEAAVGVLHRKELAAADKPDELRARLAAEYAQRLMHPFYAAERGLVDDVIDPADTRAVIARALDMLGGKRHETAPRKHGNPPA